MSRCHKASPSFTHSIPGLSQSSSCIACNSALIALSPEGRGATPGLTPCAAASAQAPPSTAQASHRAALARLMYLGSCDPQAPRFGVHEAVVALPAVGWGLAFSSAAAALIIPHWQKPHCGTSSAAHARCAGCEPSLDKPSIVTTFSFAIGRLPFH